MSSSAGDLSMTFSGALGEKRWGETGVDQFQG